MKISYLISYVLLGFILLGCSNQQAPQGPIYTETIQDAVTTAGLDLNHVVLQTVMYSYPHDATIIIVVDTVTREKYYLNLKGDSDSIRSFKSEKIPEQDVLELQACAQQHTLHASPKSLFREALEYESSMQTAGFMAVWQGECSTEWMLHGYGTVMTADITYGKIIKAVDLEDVWK